MALNSYVAAEGGEIGRAQAVQAEAARVDPSIDMNPILLKPEGDARSQVVVNGRSIGSLAAADYQRAKPALWPHVTEALARLRARYELIVVEGAGSPAEINLRAADLANMRVALHAGAPVLLVGDIDRGGVFASLLGTLELLAPDERRLVCGMAINKFRGDPAILAPGLGFLEERTGVPVLGVLPYLRDLALPEEDSLGLERPHGAGSSGCLDVAVARLPRIANFDDFDPLAAEPSIRLRYVEVPSGLGSPDLIVLPGTKMTIADLAWMRSNGLARAIEMLAATGTPVMGICGGFQMLGRRILDPARVESDEPEAAGLGLLPIATTFGLTKHAVRVRATVLPTIGPLAAARGAEVAGYEIHMGTTDHHAALRPLFALSERSGESAEGTDGVVSTDGLVLGTYLHGLFESDAIRSALIGWLLARRGSTESPVLASLDREQQYDALAAAVRGSLDVERLAIACALH